MSSGDRRFKKTIGNRRQQRATVRLLVSRALTNYLARDFSFALALFFAQFCFGVSLVGQVEFGVGIGSRFGAKGTSQIA